MFYNHNVLFPLVYLIIEQYTHVKVTCIVLHTCPTFYVRNQRSRTRNACIPTGKFRRCQDVLYCYPQERRPVIDLENSGQRTERGFALGNRCRGLENQACACGSGDVVISTHRDVHGERIMGRGEETTRTRRGEWRSIEANKKTELVSI